MLDELENGHFALNGHRNSHLAIDLVRTTVVPLAEGGQAAVLHQIGHPSVNDLDSCELVRHVVAAEPDSGR